MPRARYKKKLKNGREYFFYRLRHSNLRAPKDLYGKTQAELDEKIRRARFELDRGVTSDKAFFSDYIQTWIDTTHSIGKKETTLASYAATMKHVKGSTLDDIQLRNLSALDIQLFYKSLVDKGVSLNTIGKIHNLIKPCIRYAFSQGRILSDFSAVLCLPHTELKKKTGFRGESNPLTWDEQKAFLQHLSGNPKELLFLFILNTGLRLGEALALEWTDIDFNNSTVSVDKNVVYIKVDGSFKNILQPPKTEAGKRIVPMPDFITSRLKQHRAKQAEIRLVLADQFENNNLVFPNKKGRCMSQANVNKALKSIREKAELKHFNVHDLRHTYATRLFEAGEDPKVIQTLLGHSTIAVTLDTYTHVMENIKRKTVHSLDSIHEKMN